MRYCRFRGEQVFRDHDPGISKRSFQQFAGAHFPLLPFSNRIENGTFSFKGKSVSLKQNAPDQKHPLHGVGWINAWNVTQRTPSKIVCEQNYSADAWPWTYRAQHSVEIQGNILRMELKLKNTDLVDMPLGFGFHPYFPYMKDAVMTFQSQAVWECNSDRIPTKLIDIIPVFDLSRPQPLSGFNLDHCYEDVSDCRISWDNREHVLSIRSSDNLNKAAVYTDHEHDCFCFEPISHTHNALNMEDPLGEGIVTLKPGESETCWMEIEIIQI